ncbi:DUF4350 domain-containing protein [Cellulomonas alba]|uniref:DUF4350 domain-containing protein n=1 Tax=Cellulomonas alba TaxID=3053467 RepID=A0ABT7SCR8_9CELL|nr:DUF4350 domain-containing protein [Cellulomonas alba]MDM7853993.1 DUF4350 domain-containing protein [Cellulomonas alba]
MSTPVLTRSAPVVGDGTTARTRAAGRWRRWRVLLAIVVGLVLVALLAALPEPRTSSVRLAPDNPAPDGARAAAQILGRQGVHVHYVRRIADVRAAAHPGTTLLVASDRLLDEDQVDALAATGADLALVDAGWALERLTDQLRALGASASSDVEARDAACDDPDARAAGTITAAGAVEALGPGAVVCFPGSGAVSRSGAYAVVAGSPRIAALSDAAPLENAGLADEGNAALVLRMLGRHRDLVWYVPSVDDTSGASDASTGPSLVDLVPRTVPLVGLALLLVLAVAALWRGRRLGRLVLEPLPVVVRSGEATRGRGRLYRRARAHGHAGAALRAGTATRCAARLGLPRSAEPAAVVAAVARATGREPGTVAHLLYGPPPTDDSALTRLARDLDDLESEVQHP